MGHQKRPFLFIALFGVHAFIIASILGKLMRLLRYAGHQPSLFCAHLMRHDLRVAAHATG